MQIRQCTQLPGMTLAVMLALMVIHGLVCGPEAQAQGSRGLEGTWLFEATLVDCDTGESLPIPVNPFPVLHTYLPGGTMLDSAAEATRSAAHGIWERTGNRTFRERFRFFSFDATGAHVSTVEITVERSLIRGENAETDEVIGVGTAKFFDPAGVLVGEGCNKDSGRRFVFED